jgi:hypothetical protein
MVKSLNEIVSEFKLDAYETDVLTELLKLNDGKIKAITLRAHLSRGYGQCARITDALFENGLAQYAGENEKMKYIDVRDRGWMQNHEY